VPPIDGPEICKDAFGEVCHVNRSICTVLLASLALACGQVDQESEAATGDDPCPTGTERCPCRDDGSCDDGLACASDLCLVLPGGGEGGDRAVAGSGGAAGAADGTGASGASPIGGAAGSSGGTGGSISGGTGGSVSGGTGGSATGGTGGSATGGTGGWESVPSDCPTDWPQLPGTPITDLETVGVGACAGRRLSELTSTTELAPYPYSGMDGNRTHAFLTNEGFALVDKSGSGDCESGCIDNWYAYYMTDDNCELQLVGSYDPPIASSEGCLELVGEPLWGIPARRDPAIVCGESMDPQDISGTYELFATGTRVECLADGTPDSIAFADLVSLTIEQNADLSTGTVTITGTGSPFLDGIPLTAAFERRGFSVVQLPEPTTCEENVLFLVSFDFEGYGTLSASGGRPDKSDLDCTAVDGCAGPGISLNLCPH